MSVEERLALAFITDHPQDGARLLERVDPGDAAALLARLPAGVSAAVYRLLAPGAAAASLTALPDDALARMLEALPLDAAVATLRNADGTRRGRLLALLDEDRRKQLSTMLSYRENTAGALADPLVLALPDDITVADAQQRMRGSHQHPFYYLYVVARDRTLVGTLALPELMAARAQDTLATVMRRNLVSLDVRAELATVAAHPAWRDFDALPVVDARGKLIGAIRHKTIRQMKQDTGQPVTATLVGLSELYWAGLSGMLSSLVPPQARTQEDDHVP